MKVVKNVREWQGVSNLARALGSYPNRVKEVQAEYDLFDVRPVTAEDNLSPQQWKLQEMWRLKSAATVQDFEDAAQELGAHISPPAPPLAPKIEPPLPKPLPARPAPAELAPLSFIRRTAATVTVTQHVEPAPFHVSTPADLVAALHALALAVAPDAGQLTLVIAGVTHKAGGK